MKPDACHCGSFTSFRVGGSAPHIICLPPRALHPPKTRPKYERLQRASPALARPPHLEQAFLHMPTYHLFPSTTSSMINIKSPACVVLGGIHAHVHALSTNRSQLVAPHMLNSFGHLIGSPNEDRLRTFHHNLRHGCQTKLNSLHKNKVEPTVLAAVRRCSAPNKAKKQDAINKMLTTRCKHESLYLLTFFLTYLLPFFLTYLFTFFLTYLLTFFLTSFWHIFWHSFWHIFWHSFLTFLLTWFRTFLLTFILTYLLTFFLTYLLTFFLTYLLTFFLLYLLAYLPTFFGTYLLTFCLAHLLTWFLTYLLTFFLTYLSWHSFWHIFWHSFWHIFLTYFLTFFLTYLLTFFLTYLLTFLLTYLFDMSPDISSDISFYILSDISSDISFWHFFWHIFWHSFWHIFCHFFLTYLLTFVLTYLSPFFLTYLLAFFLTYLFDISPDILPHISSDILSDISFDILSDLSSDILPDISFTILSDISFDILSDNIFWHSFWHLSDISFDILSDISSDISFWHFFWHIFCHSFWHIFCHSFWHIFCHSFWQIVWHNTWGPARHTELTGSRLGSSTPHWTRTIAVGVQHATLNLQCRGWGPARHTKLIRSRLGSSMPHRTHKIAVGVQHATLNWENASCNCGPARHTERRESQLIEEDDKGQEDDDEGGEGGEGEEGEEGGEGEGGGEESDIKSNNPHLTGGEIDFLAISYPGRRMYMGIKMRHDSKKIQTYPWNIPENMNHLFMKEILSCLYFGVAAVCSKGLLEFSWTVLRFGANIKLIIEKLSPSLSVCWYISSEPNSTIVMEYQKKVTQTKHLNKCKGLFPNFIPIGSMWLHENLLKPIINIPKHTIIPWDHIKIFYRSTHQM